MLAAVVGFEPTHGFPPLGFQDRSLKPAWVHRRMNVVTPVGLEPNASGLRGRRLIQLD